MYVCTLHSIVDDVIFIYDLQFFYISYAILDPVCMHIVYMCVNFSRYV